MMPPCSSNCSRRLRKSVATCAKGARDDVLGPLCDALSEYFLPHLHRLVSGPRISVAMATDETLDRERQYTIYVADPACATGISGGDTDHHSVVLVAGTLGDK